MGVSNGDVDDLVYPVWGCGASFQQFASTGANRTLQYYPSSNPRFPSFLIAVQVLAGSASMTIQITALQVPTNGASTIDVVLGGPASPVSNIPTYSSSFSSYVSYRIAINPSQFSVATQIRFTVSNLGSVQSTSAGRVTMYASRSLLGFTDWNGACTSSTLGKLV